MTATPDDVPAWPPGSTEAYAMGCRCTLRDGEQDPGNPDWPDWLTMGCPLHGQKVGRPLDDEGLT